MLRGAPEAEERPLRFAERDPLEVPGLPALRTHEPPVEITAGERGVEGVAGDPRSISRRALPDHRTVPASRRAHGSAAIGPAYITFSGPPPAISANPRRLPDSLHTAPLPHRALPHNPRPCPVPPVRGSDARGFPSGLHPLRESAHPAAYTRGRPRDPRRGPRPATIHGGLVDSGPRALPSGLVRDAIQRRGRHGHRRRLHASMCPSAPAPPGDRKSTRLNSSHITIS